MTGGRPDPAAGRPELGVYLHVPFCRDRCDYCAFATYTDRDEIIGRYVAACRAEIRRGVAGGSLPPATSVYVGGGTPSRLAAADLCSLLDEVPRNPACEVTVECNPEDASAPRLAAYRRAGVTRISLGVQAISGRVLGSLGRRQDPPIVGRAAHLVAEAGFPSWSADLIFGAAAETDDDWRRCLETVLGWPAPPPHVSAYGLTVEPGTPLASDPARHPDDDAQARRYLLADHLLSEAGYVWEEISNWTRPGHSCRHNRLYWNQGDYVGIGSSAHSHRDGHRWWNLRTPERYVAAVEEGRSPVAGEERLSPEERAFERLALSLRTPRGVEARALAGQRHELDGLVSLRAGRAVLTPRGRLLANEVTARLAVPQTPARRPTSRRGSRGQPVSSRR